MADIHPFVPEQLEDDLRPVLREVVIRYIDDHGVERQVRVNGLVYRPVFRAMDERGRFDVPLERVTEVAVNDTSTRSEPTGFYAYPLVVSRWHRSQWGELIRFRPE